MHVQLAALHRWLIGRLAWKLTTHFFGPIRKLIFLKDFLKYTLSDDLDLFKVKLHGIKPSFNTIRMQIVRHVTDEGAEEGV